MLEKEIDPHGKSQHEAGAKLDHNKNRLGLVLNGFAHALVEVGKVGTYGANKYSPNGWKEVPNGIDRYTDAMLRHQFLEVTEGDFDVLGGSGLRHAAQVAWNSLARLELLLVAESNRRAAEQLIPTPTAQNKKHLPKKSSRS